MRKLLGTGAWAAALALATALGGDIARATQRIEQRIELQIRERNAPPPDLQQRERTHEEAIEPWELVNV